MDEVVALGTSGRDGRIVAEFNRVLRPGGRLLLGEGVEKSENTKSTWGVRLARMGYMPLELETKMYPYKGNQPEPVSYTVLVWQKGPETSSR